MENAFLVFVKSSRILAFVLIDKWHHVEGANPHENNLAVIKLIVYVFVFCDNATFSNFLWSELILSSDLNIALPLCLEGYNIVVL